MYTSDSAGFKVVEDFLNWISEQSPTQPICHQGSTSSAWAHCAIGTFLDYAEIPISKQDKLLEPLQELHEHVYSLLANQHPANFGILQQVISMHHEDQKDILDAYEFLEELGAV